MPAKLSQKEFINRAQKVHPELDYSNTEYQNALTKIKIGCPQHGVFDQLPFNNLKGVGCPVCGAITRSRNKTLDTVEFITKATEVHDGKYDYSRVEYTGYNDKVSILCPHHGAFEQRANNHLAGVGCNKCAIASRSAILLKPLSKFITTAQVQHKDKYGYKGSVYQGAFKPVEISCPMHGDFWQTPDAHLNSGSGCPLCSHRNSLPHQEIENFLDDLMIAYRKNDRTQIHPYELDDFIPSHNLAIEFNGRYWHSLDGTEPPSTKYRHRDKFRLCQQGGILLLQIDEHEWSNPVTREVWKSVIGSKLGKHKRLYARDTTFRPISSAEANAFLTVNHLQGATPAIRWSFGVFFKDELVGVLSYCHHQHTQTNLSRMAFKTNTTVVGGAEKLFKNSLNFLPTKDIISFSNNRYSGGDIYSRLGFTKQGEVQPSYQWYFKGRIWNKRSLRRSVLSQLLPEFNPAETEHQNLYRNGARCLYDAGYQKWVFYRDDPTIESLSEELRNEASKPAPE